MSFKIHVRETHILTKDRFIEYNEGKRMVRKVGIHRRRQDRVTTAHTIIGDFKKTLVAIASLPKVQSIHTGTIAPHKSTRERLDFQYFTESGLKLLAKTTEAVQEVFVVTSSPEQVKEQLEKMGFLTPQESVRKKGKKGPRNASRPASRGGQQDTRDVRGNPQPMERTMGDDGPSLTMRERLPAELVEKLRTTVRMENHSPGPSSARNDAASPANDRSQDASGSAEERFAEGWDPPEETESFEELLKKSTLDWKPFKG